MEYQASKKEVNYKKNSAKINNAIREARYEVARLELERQKLNIKYSKSFN